MSHIPPPYRIKNKKGNYLSDKSPWSAEHETASNYGSFPIMAGKETVALVLGVGWSDSLMKQNGEFITRACNSHYELLKTLRQAKKFIEEITLANGKYPELNASQIVADAYKEASKIRAIIEKAEGK